MALPELGIIVRVKDFASKQFKGMGGNVNTFAKTAISSMWPMVGQIGNVSTAIAGLTGNIGAALGLGPGFTAFTGIMRGFTDQVKTSFATAGDSSISLGRKFSILSGNLMGLVTTAGLAITVLGIGLAGALAKMTKSVATNTDEITKMARKYGLTTATLSKFQLAVELTGTTIDAMAIGIRTLAVNLELAKRGTGEAKIALDKLSFATGVMIDKTAPTEEIILQLAEAFSKLENTAGKTALASQILGSRAGPELLILLNEGRSGIEAIMKKAIELGIVFDEKTGLAAERFNDAMTELTFAFEGFKLKALAPLLPALSSVFRTMTDFFAKTGKNAQTWGKDILQSFMSVSKGVLQTADFINKLFKSFKLVFHGINFVLKTSVLIMLGLFRGLTTGISSGLGFIADISDTAIRSMIFGWNQLKKVWLGIKASFLLLKKTLASGFSAIADMMIKVVGEMPDKIVPEGLLDDLLNLKVSVDQTKDSVDKDIADLGDSVNQLDKWPPRLKATEDALKLFESAEKAIVNNIDITILELSDSIKDSVNKIKQSFIDLEGIDPNRVEKIFAKIQVGVNREMKLITDTVKDNMDKTKINIDEATKEMDLKVTTKKLKESSKEINKANKEVSKTMSIEYDKSKEKVKDFRKEFIASMESITKQGINSAQLAFQGFERFFFEAMQGRLISFKSFALGILQDFARQSSKLLSAELVSFFFGGGVAGGGPTKFTPIKELAGTVPKPGSAVPIFQEGGIVRKPTVALTGEAGPEAIVPLKRGAIPVQLAGAGGGAQTININFNVTANDTKGFDRLLFERKNMITNIIADAVIQKPGFKKRIRG